MSNNVIRQAMLKESTVAVAKVPKTTDVGASPKMELELGFVAAKSGFWTLNRHFLDSVQKAQGDAGGNSRT